MDFGVDKAVTQNFCQLVTKQETNLLEHNHQHHIFEHLQHRDSNQQFHVENDLFLVLNDLLQTLEVQ